MSIDEERRRWLEGLKKGDSVAIVDPYDTLPCRGVVLVATAERLVVDFAEGAFKDDYGWSVSRVTGDGESWGSSIRKIEESDELRWRLRKKLKEMDSARDFPITKVRKLLAALEETEHPKENA